MGGNKKAGAIMRHVLMSMLLLLLQTTMSFANCLFSGEQWGKTTLTPMKGSLPSDEVAYINAIETSVRKNFEPSVGRLPDSRLRRYGEPVGRLEMLYEDKSSNRCVSVCTGFLVAEGKLLTNRHCLMNEKIKSMIAIKFRLGYLAENSPGVSYDVENKPVEVGEKLDYAILAVNGHPEEKFGLVNLEPVHVEAGRDLIIIGHPLGQPQQFSVSQCVVAPSQDHVDSFRHLCQTTAGNSGSPIFDEQSGAVIALHQTGPGNIGILSTSTQADSQRSGIPISTIVAYSNTLQGVSTAPARVELSNFRGFDLEFDVRRNGRLICRIDAHAATDMEQVCPVDLEQVSQTPLYEVSGTLKTPTGQVVNFKKRLNINDGDDSGACKLLLRRKGTKAIDFSQVCG